MKLKAILVLFGAALLAAFAYQGLRGGDRAAEGRGDSARVKDELVMCMGTRPPGEFDPRKRWGLKASRTSFTARCSKKRPT